MKIDVEDLLLDPENPRLPEELTGASQERLFEYLYRHGVLDELVDSMLDNGFFDHEPLIVLPPNEDGKQVVVEGNRRLAALMLIHALSPTGDHSSTREPEPDERDRLEAVTCHKVGSREEVRAYLGFRHISGLRPWRPEAKARYVTEAVGRARDEGDERPFLVVAKQIGSNIQGVRNAYVALATLRHARIACGVDVGFVLTERFGVWMRCMNSPEIRGFFGYQQSKTLVGVEAALDEIDCDRLAEVLQDLTPGEGGARPVLSDSRDATQYGLVLNNESAYKVLRRYGDLQLAMQIVTSSAFPDRVRELRATVDALRDEATEGAAVASESLLAETEHLLRSVRLLQGVVKALVEDEE